MSLVRYLVFAGNSNEVTIVTLDTCLGENKEGDTCLGKDKEGAAHKTVAIVGGIFA